MESESFDGLIEIASYERLIMRLAGLEQVADAGHPAMRSACRLYFHAVKDWLDERGPRRLPCAAYPSWASCTPSVHNVMHGGYLPLPPRRSVREWDSIEWSFSAGAVATMATDLSEAERAAIVAAHEAGVAEAAREISEW